MLYNLNEVNMVLVKTFENVVCQASSILCMPQYVKFADSKFSYFIFITVSHIPRISIEYLSLHKVAMSTMSNSVANFPLDASY